MLQIKHKHTLKLKQKYFVDRPGQKQRMQFSAPLLDTSDEMAAAIANEIQDSDDNWTLDERPDGEQLADFWEMVRNEARQDPNWNFADENEA